MLCHNMIIDHNKYHPKGQLISKGLFAVFICTKNERKYFSISALKIVLLWVRGPLKDFFFLLQFVLKSLVIFLIQINKVMNISYNQTYLCDITVRHANEYLAKSI